VTDPKPTRLTRRRFLAGAGTAVGVGLLAGCATGGASTQIGPGSAQVAGYADSQRRRFPDGRVLTQQLDAAPSTVDIGGQTVQAWTYQGQLPGPPLRARVGDRLAVRVRNGPPGSAGSSTSSAP
jgi:FtsP/CotA-like multicopper oxidase with cupredoxin domain